MNWLKKVFQQSSQNDHKISVQQAKEMMDTQDVIIIDVREENEYVNGHIPHSHLVPLNTIHQNNHQLPDKNQTLLVYCRSGKRSKKAAKKLISLGYQNVYDFGGIIDWPYKLIK